MPTTIYAHRGASGSAPENTMAAFQKAWEAGAEGIETDVQLTKDNIPVLIHDERLKRTTGNAQLVKDVTYEQICKLNANYKFPHFSQTPIPSLEDLLKWAKDKPLQLNLELKNNRIAYKHLESIVIELLESYHLTNQTVISTFNLLSLKKLTQLHTNIEIAYLIGRRFSRPLAIAKEMGADALHVKMSLLSRKLSDACRKENINLRVYTPNHQKQLMKCLLLNCDGVITDYPEKAIDCRKKLS